MSIDDKINEALGISTDKPATKQVIKKDYTPPVPRLEDKNKELLSHLILQVLTQMMILVLQQRLQVLQMVKIITQQVIVMNNYEYRR